MSPQEVKKAQELKESGYSVREIGELLDVPKSTVDRALRDTKGVGELPEAPNGPSVDKEIALASLKLSHEMKMAEVGVEQQTLAIRRQEAANKSKELDLEQLRLEQGQTAELERLDARKRVLVSKYNRLVQELLDNCRKSTWEEEEIDEYLVRLDALQEKILLFCEKQGIDEEELHIWQSLLALEHFWETQKEEHTGFFSSSVDLDATSKERATMKQWLVNDFDDLASGDQIDEDEDEDEEEEDDEELEPDEELDEELDTYPHRHKR